MQTNLTDFFLSEFEKRLTQFNLIAEENKVSFYCDEKTFAVIWATQL